MKVVLAGGSGFIGRAVAAELAGQGHQVVSLDRHPNRDPVVKSLIWDGRTVGDWAIELEDALAVINLAGAPIAQWWTYGSREEILQSRVVPTQTLGKAIGASPHSPKVWINGSASGYYGDSGPTELCEDAPSGAGFLADVCIAWEEAMAKAVTPQTQKIRIRTGVVLGRKGGALPALDKLARSFIGGAAGNGDQYTPWIHVQDLARLFVWSISQATASVVNASAPAPTQNAEFMLELRKLHQRPWAPPAPQFLFKLAGSIGFPAEMILSSQRMLPCFALREGFKFAFTDLQSTLQDVLLQ